MCCQAADPAEALRQLYNDRKKNYGLVRTQPARDTSIAPYNKRLLTVRCGSSAQADVKVALSADDSPIRVLRRVTHRIIEELDMRPPKAKAWEEKREKMRQM